MLFNTVCYFTVCYLICLLWQFLSLISCPNFRRMLYIRELQAAELAAKFDDSR